MELCDLSDLRAYGKAVARQGEDTGTSQKVLLSHGEKSLAEIFFQLFHTDVRNLS